MEEDDTRRKCAGRTPRRRPVGGSAGGSAANAVMRATEGWTGIGAVLLSSSCLPDGRGAGVPHIKQHLERPPG